MNYLSIYASSLSLSHINNATLHNKPQH